MKVSAGSLQASLTQPPRWNAFTTAANSSFENFCVGLPTLSMSLHELPVFQSHRPTTFPVEQVKSSGTTQLALMWLPIVEAASDVAHA